MRDNLYKFLTENDYGICVSISDNGIRTSQFIAENEFAGVTRKSMSPIQPILKNRITANDILVEFNKLIFSDIKESCLEEFCGNITRRYLEENMIESQHSYG